MASQGFDEIYAFGDSLSDSGRIFQVSNQLLALAIAAGIDTQGLQPFPVSPPYAGKFSNGAVCPKSSRICWMQDWSIFPSAAGKLLARNPLARPPAQRFQHTC